MSHVADSPKSRHFEPISGRSTPSGPQISAKSGSGGSLLGTRETWIIPTVPLATVLLTPHASRPTLHAPRQTSGVEWCADPPLATACHRPPNCQKSKGPDLYERLSISVCHRTRRFLRTKSFNQFVPLHSPPLTR